MKGWVISSTLKRKLRHGAYLPFLPLILAPLVLLSPVLFTGKALYWGTPSTQFVPWWDWAYRTLWSGHLPLWNPLLGMGAPLVANYQSALYYPPNWLIFLLATIGGTPALAWGQALLVAAHLAWAGIGMALLVRRLGLGPLAQTISSLAFGLSGYLVARSAFLSINAAAAWLPWVILGVTDLFESDWAGKTVTGKRSSSIHSGWRALWESKWRGITLLSVCFGLQFLAGHAQTTWYTLLLAAAWAGFWVVVTKIEAEIGHDEISENSDTRGGASSWEWLRRFAWVWGILALAVMLGAALAAVQLLPTAEYLMQSQRAQAVDYEFAMTYSFWPWRFLTLLSPGLFGNPVQGDYWGYANYWEDAVYIGLLPFLMAVMAILRRGKGSGVKGNARLVYFLVGVVIISFLFALGKNTPLFPFLYRHMPTFDMFQAPTRWTLLAVFALCLLAGIGIEAWRRPEARGLYWTRLGTMGAAAILVGAGIAATGMVSALGSIRLSLVRSMALLGMWGVGVGILALTAPARWQTRQVDRGWWAWMVVAWTALDLILAGWGINPGIDLDFYRQASPTAQQVHAMLGGGRLYLPERDEKQLKFERFFRFDTFDPGEDWMHLRASLLPDVNLLDEIASANNFDPLVPGRYATWIAQLEAANPTLKTHMLNLMAIKVVEKLDSSQPYGVRFEARPALDRIRWVPCGIAVRDPQDALESILNRSGDPLTTVHLEGVAEVPKRECDEVKRAEVQPVSENPNRLNIHVQSEAPGYLVIADVWYPGWRARVDSKSTPVLRADYLFKALAIPAGEHEIVISFRPWTSLAGAIVSALAWLGLVTFFVIKSIRQNRT